MPIDYPTRTAPIRQTEINLNSKPTVLTAIIDSWSGCSADKVFIYAVLVMTDGSEVVFMVRLVCFRISVTLAAPTVHGVVSHVRILLGPYKPR